ncbi:lantibiotic dehydratase [Streptomyces canus]|uniref:lantibiotic dehydratase n=1 Tax=Streptomyces canus TaxID=58343 RepID=UPI0033DF4F01
MEDLEQLRAFLAAVAGDPLVREAIAVSSLPLDLTLERVSANKPVKSKQLRRGAASALRYLKRMRHRATPFGLMAGVASATFADDAEVRIGARHHKHVRPDLAWLIQVVRDLNRDPTVRSRLRVVANDLCCVRGYRLIVPRLLAGNDEDGGHGRETSVSCTPMVRAALDCARTPVSFRQLAGRVAAACPAEDEAAVEQQLGELVDRDVLLTELYPPLTDPDPFGHVLRTLATTGNKAAGERLGVVADALDDYAVAPIGTGHSRLRTVARAMQEIHLSDRPLHIDLGVDATLVLPRLVAAEMADAAAMAWRLSLPPSRPLAEYHARFLERYGLRGLVPVRELLDPHAGLGVPSRRSPDGRRAAFPDELTTDRDTLLCGLAQRAAAQSEREVVIDEELADRLAHPGTEEPGAYIEPVARLFAASKDNLTAGDFRLLLSTMNFTRPGAMFGRFLHLLPKLRDPFARCVDELTASWSPATAAHLVAPTLPARSANVAQVPQLTPDTLLLGTFAGTEDPHVLRLDDLAVGAHRERLYVVSLRTGEEIVPLPFNANEMRITAPDPVRMLFQIGAFRTPRWSIWSWGATANQLPFLPRVRHGRTILASARWLPDERLTDPKLDPVQWRRLFDRWREEWRVPERLEAVCADQLLPLDLSSAADIQVLHDELLRHPGTFLREEPLGGAFGTGWAGGRSCELAVALVPRQQHNYPAVRATLPLPTVVDPAMTRRVHHPGGDWLSLKVYAITDRHDEILSRALPALLEQTTSLTDRWFYVRYQDDEPHLRIRFHGKPAGLNSDLMPAVHEWADRLAAAGGIRDLVIDTYRPELARYGGPEVMEAAEQAFCADSRAAVEQLQLRDKGHLDIPAELLLAANQMDMAARLIGDGWQDWLLKTYPKGAHHRVFQRYRNEAVAFLSPLLATDGGALRMPDELTQVWERRAPSLTHYGHLIREAIAEGRLGTAPAPFRSVLHMHHNRLGGMNPEAEQGSYAIARGVLQTVTDRKRHLNSESRRATYGDHDRAGPSAGPRRSS